MNPNTCYYHPNLPASIVCNRCGRRICDSCRTPYNGLTLCPACYHTVPVSTQGASVAPNVAPVAPMAGTPPTPAPIPVGSYGGMTTPGTWYGPYVPKTPLLMRFSWISSVLVVFASGLIIANGLALTSPSFAAWWNTIIPWNASLGSVSIILGVILGVVLLVAVVMIFLKYKVLSAFVIFPTALVSIFIGGGFILGAILGVLAGILLIL
ncbi:MAG TPA: hypothetical protein VE862_01540 [Candidatus Acidoferrum sp.]|nr:hypothetical protein [Candidatus Acidoferrum sp.]